MQSVTLSNVSRSLVLWRAVHKSDKEAFETQGCIQVKPDGPDAGYIVLRATPDAAVERAHEFYDRASKETHCLLRVGFTEKGVTHYVTSFKGADWNFQSTLFKNIFWREDVATD